MLVAAFELVAFEAVLLLKLDREGRKQQLGASLFGVFLQLRHNAERERLEAFLPWLGAFKNYKLKPRVICRQHVRWSPISTPCKCHSLFYPHVADSTHILVVKWWESTYQRCHGR